MKCQKCKKNVATVTYTENINGKKTKYSLCEDCAKELDIDNLIIDEFGNSLFKSFFKQNLVQEKKIINEKKCSCCGCTFEDIIKLEKLGCSNCYDEFQDKLDIIFKKMHGKNRHVGRKKQEMIENKKNQETNEVNKIEEKNNTINELEKLKEKLKELIKEEKYEEAAKIRDEIKKIKDINEN